MTDVTRYLDGRTLILLSNREPYEHLAGQRAIHVRQPPGGLVSALDPTMRRTQRHLGRVGLRLGRPRDRRRSRPPRRAAVRARVHAASRLARRRATSRATTSASRTARSGRSATCSSSTSSFIASTGSATRASTRASRRAVVRGVAARERRRRRCGCRTITSRSSPAELRATARRTSSSTSSGTFRFRRRTSSGCLPMGVPEALLRGLLGNDLIEFHTERYAHNFLTAFASSCPTRRSRGESLRVSLDGRHGRTSARFPISIDVEAFERLALSEDSDARASALRQRYARGGRALGVSVDRVDYTKGIPERLRALDRLWQRVAGAARALHVDLRRHAVAHRAARRIRRSRRRCSAAVREINERYGTRRLDADRAHPRERPRRAARGDLSRGRPLPRVVAAGRNEPRREGVRRVPGRRARRAGAEPLHRRGRGDRGRGAHQPVQRRRVRGRHSRPRSRWSPTSGGGACARCARSCIARRSSTGSKASSRAAPS